MGLATRRRRPAVLALVAAIGLIAAACGEDGTAQSSQPTTEPAVTEPAAVEPEVTQPPASDPPTTAAATAAAAPAVHRATAHAGEVDLELLLPAYLGAAPFQDVQVAEAAGWVSTIDTLGCFESADAGGMGVHWLNEALLDDRLDPAEPEALVYELDADGEVAGLVGHEYLVPFDAWTATEPPSLFGIDLHEHPVLPFWILHAYLWKDNPSGMFADWNPTVRPCPPGVGVFGVDLP